MSTLCWFEPGIGWIQISSSRQWTISWRFWYAFPNTQGYPCRGCIGLGSGTCRPILRILWSETRRGRGLSYLKSSSTLSYLCHYIRNLVDNSESVKLIQPFILRYQLCLNGKTIDEGVEWQWALQSRKSECKSTCQIGVNQGLTALLVPLHS